MFTKKSCSVHRISPMYQFLSKLPYFSKQTLFFFFLIDICVECDQTECMNCWMSIFYVQGFPQYWYLFVFSYCLRN